MSFVPDYVEHPDAWLRGKDARIKSNRWKTGRRQLLSELQGEPDLLRWIMRPGVHEFISDEDRALMLVDDTYHDAPARDRAVTDAIYQLAHEEMNKYYKAYGVPPEFITNSIDEWGGLTPKQLEVARRIWNERKERATKREQERALRKANAPDWKAGRQEVEGIVKSIRSHETPLDFGRCAYSYKGMVELEDGRTLWTTIPLDLVNSMDEPDNIRGERIRMKITIALCDSDPTHAFGSRPTNSVRVVL